MTQSFPSSHDAALQALRLRVEDPDTPVVWIDPAIAGELWPSLDPFFTAAGYGVRHIDDEAAVAAFPELMERFRSLFALPDHFREDFNSLKDSLLGLSWQGNGTLLLFRNPGELRQSDEEAFEDLLDVLGLVHDTLHDRGRPPLKLIVAG